MHQSVNVQYFIVHIIHQQIVLVNCELWITDGVVVVKGRQSGPEL